LVVVVVVDLTVETEVVVVSFDSALQLVHGCLRPEQNLHFKWARGEQRAATHHHLLALREFCHESLGEDQHVLLQTPVVVVEGGHLTSLHWEVLEAVEVVAQLDRVQPHSSPDVEISAQLKTIHPESGTQAFGF
jgi:hypothetical protein